MVSAQSLSAGSDGAASGASPGRARYLALRAFPLLLFLGSLWAASFAQNNSRPLTAAMILLFAVATVGALEGVWAGLLAGIVASLTYNFFLSDPVFRFSLTSAEEYVPLIAFNLTAVASGLLTGQLKERALAAELANRRLNQLLEVSDRLQSAVRLHDIPAAMDGFTAAGVPEVYLGSEAGLRPLSADLHSDLAETAWRDRGGGSEHRGEGAFLLVTPDGPCGVLVVPGTERSQVQQMEGVVNLLSIAVQRCMLLEQVAEAELVRRSEELKTALLSSVSHDVRTPLSAISASASSLARFGGSLSDETRADLLDMILEQCERLNRYTTNLLNLGRIQAGVDPDRFAACDALEVLGAAIAQARSLATGHRIVKHYEVERGNVRADPAMLEQVFYNVLENALQYSAADTEIEVSARAAEGQLVVTIADQGPGIASEDLKRVFARFYRGASSGSRDGSGLGLSIAKGFTEAFGGRIEALPREGAREGPREGPREGAHGGTAIRISLAMEGDLS